MQQQGQDRKYVFVQQNICVLADRNVITFILRVVVQQHGKLLAGNTSIRNKPTVPNATGNTVFGRPSDGVLVVFARWDISLMVAAGIPREQIQRILGHAQYSTTADYYVHAWFG